MVRQVVLFHSDLGLEVRVYLILLQAGEMLIAQGDDWLEVLEEELRKARLQILQEERTLLLGQVARLDERIRGLGGKRGPGRPRASVSAQHARSVAPAAARHAAVKAPAKGRGGKTQGGMIQGLIRKALADGASVSIAQLVDRVKSAGYEGKASPSNLRIMLVKTLKKNREFFRKVRRGVYRLRKETAVEGQARK